MPATKQRKPRPPEPYARHPWTEWFMEVSRKGSIILRRGVHYRGESRVFLQQIGTRARKVEWMDVRTRRITKPYDGIEITINKE